MILSLTIIGTGNAKVCQHQTDSLITPQVGDVGMHDFTRKKCRMEGQRFFLENAQGIAYSQKLPGASNGSLLVARYLSQRPN